jgi:uncharacterized protein DUF4154
MVAACRSESATGSEPMRLLFICGALLGILTPCGSAELPEYQLKAAYLYNFAQFTAWPAGIGKRLTLCVFGSDPFGADLDRLQDKLVGTHTLQVQRGVALGEVAGCQVLYISRDAVGSLPALLGRIGRKPVLIVTDSPGAARVGAMLNMTVAQNRVTFEANRRAANDAGLELSSRLLRLATEVIQ